jgi:di/tricarboxylate transporter
MSTEIILTFAVLGITIFLFVSEWLRVDVVALCVMLALPWLGLVEPHEALAGLSSNAVFSIIAVMILGRGVDRSGIMAKVTRPILRVAGSSERRLVSLVSAAVGAISAFMQNIGAAALFLPALLRIAKRTGLPESRLLMPVGFAAILGGTLTMVASGPLIILNDILRQGGQSPFGLFAVTPVGLTLLVAGILYFIILGPVVLPSRKDRGAEPSAQQRRPACGRPMELTCFCCGKAATCSPPPGARPTSPLGRNSCCSGPTMRLRVSLRTTVSSWIPRLPSGSNPSWVRAASPN